MATQILNNSKDDVLITHHRNLAVGIKVNAEMLKLKMSKKQLKYLAKFIKKYEKMQKENTELIREMLKK